MHEVRRSVGSRERHGDDEVRGGEPEQHKHEDLAAPTRKEILQHGDAALTVGAGCRDALVDRKGRKEGHHDKYQGCIGEIKPAARNAMPD